MAEFPSDEKTLSRIEGPHHDTGDSVDVGLDKTRERKLLRKIDLFVIPVLGLLYLMAFLDRGNIGNANIAGMPKDIGLTGNQYGTAVSVLYATYCTFEPVFAILFKKLTPRYTFAILVIFWSAITIGTAFTKSYGGLLAARLCLGITEAGLFPCINMYITMNYRPSEQGVRFSYIYLCAALSGAFGGLLAYGLVQMDGVAGWEGWRWLYAIEGAITFCMAPLAFFWLPDELTSAWFLNSEERELAALRAEINHHYRAEDQFQWSEIIASFKDWKTWTYSVIQFAHDITLYGFSTFLPAIVKGLGYTFVTAQLMTVPVYIWAAISFMIAARISDRILQRGIFVIIANAIIAVGFFILIFADSHGVRYFGTFVVATGVYPSTAFNLIWNNANNPSYYRRATSTGVMQMIGNTAGAVVGQVFVAHDSPRYIKGMAVALGGNGLAIAVSACLIGGLVMMNRDDIKSSGNERNDEEAMGVPGGVDDTTTFRFTY